MSKTISLCMVLRNEAKRLHQAIQSAHGLYDELIVVDTGSEDGTADIARIYGATVIESDPGLDDMSAWRNIALEAATGAWAVFLDADQEITDAAALRAFLEALPAEVGGCHLLYNNIEEGRVVLAWSELRAMRPGAYRYKYREHETPIPVADTRESACSVAIRHYPRRSDAKSDAQLRRLQMSVDEHPGDLHPRYFLARHLAARGDYEQAIPHFNAYLAMATPDNDVCEAYGNLAACYVGLGNLDRALACLHNCLLNQPHRRVWWIRLAEIYRAAGRHNIALAYLRGAAELLPVGEQHAQPVYTGPYLYELMQACQMEYARERNV